MTNTEPTSSQLRHTAQERLLAAAAALAGRPGMTLKERQHAVADAAVAAASAQLSIALLAHKLAKEGLTEEANEQAVQDFTAELANLEQMLSTASLDAPTEGEEA